MPLHIVIFDESILGSGTRHTYRPQHGKDEREGGDGPVNRRRIPAFASLFLYEVSTNPSMSNTHSMTILPRFKEQNTSKLFTVLPAAATCEFFWLPCSSSSGCDHSECCAVLGRDA
jgi:hypothetical protein